MNLNTDATVFMFMTTEHESESSTALRFDRERFFSVTIRVAHANVWLCRN